MCCCSSFSEVGLPICKSFLVFIAAVHFIVYSTLKHMWEICANGRSSPTVNVSVVTSTSWAFTNCVALTRGPVAAIKINYALWNLFIVPILLIHASLYLSVVYCLREISYSGPIAVVAGTLSPKGRTTSTFFVVALSKHNVHSWTRLNRVERLRTLLRLSNTTARVLFCLCREHINYFVGEELDVLLAFVAFEMKYNVLLSYVLVQVSETSLKVNWKLNTYDLWI